MTLLAWGMASAPGSSPDDNYHMASIVCARGVSSRCAEVTGDPTMRVIPWEVNAISCYAFHSESSAGCLIGLDDPYRTRPATRETGTAATRRCSTSR